MNVVANATPTHTQWVIIHIFFIILLLQINDGNELYKKSRKLNPNTFKSFEKYSSSKTCEVFGRLGDCNPESCGKTKTCEGRYTRFWDQQLQMDRTQKSCKCVQVIF